MSLSNHVSVSRVAMALFALAAPALFSQQPRFLFGDGRPTFARVPPEYTAAAPGGPSLPAWHGSFSHNSTTYRYTMVGSNPMFNNSTTVHVVLVPLRFVFADGTVLDATQTVSGGPASAAQLTIGSPIFQPLTYAPGGTMVGSTQYVDAYQRANFWDKVSRFSPDYHVYLSPSVAPVYTVNVPRIFGRTVPGPGAPIGQVNINWFDRLLKDTIMPSYAQINPSVLPVFLTYNTFWTQAGNCCILGYHSATGSRLNPQTYSAAAFNDPNIFSVPIQDIHALSHEVGEWMNDPFVNNTVPAWSGGQIGPRCSTLLENGDPVTGIAFAANVGGFTYHPEDLVFLPWFTREVPSSSVNGWYTFLNTYSSPAAVCN